MLNTMEEESFGARLRRLRTAARLSQRKLAALVALDNSTISLAESGGLWVDQLPSYDIVRRLAVALAVSPEELAGEAVATLAPVAEVEEVPRGAGPEAPAPREPDAPYSPEQIVAYLKANPDPIFRERILRREERMAPDAFARLCLRIYRAQASNFHAIVETAEESDGELWGPSGTP